MDTKKTQKQAVSRRDFLKLGSAAAAGSWLVATIPVAAAGNTARSTAAQDTVDVTFMIHSGELSEDEIAVFHEKNPGVNLTRVDVDQTRLFAMMAAGEPPDVFRLQYTEFPQLLARDLVLNLQSYFEASPLIKFDDLVEPNNFYKATDPFNIGEGDIYGMIKDWSPDTTLFVNDAIFEEAGVEPVSSTEPLSYDEVLELARQLTKFDGDRAEVVGLAWNHGWVDRYWTMWLYSKGLSMFSEDMTEANITDNEELRAAIQWHLDTASEKVAFSPLIAYNAWAGPDFVAGSIAMVQFGYWFSAFLRLNSAENEGFQQLMEEGKIRMVTAPKWQDGEHISPTITATAAVISKDSPNPDQAFRVFEWYNAEDPAITRADIGWGVPALKSLFNRIPKDGVYGELMWAALENEMTLSGAIIPHNPYLQGGEPGIVGSVFLTNWEQYLSGDMDFDTLVATIQDETDFAIEEGMDRIG